MIIRKVVRLQAWPTKFGVRACFGLLLAVLVLLASPAHADSIGINFMGGFANYNPNGGTLAPTDVAGVHGPGNPDFRQANWNNMLPNNAVNGTYAGLLDSQGAVTTAALDVSGVSGLWSIDAVGTKTADDRLMRGYLDPVLTVANVQVSNIPYSLYDVVVYIDGDNSIAHRVGQYQINDLPPVFVRDIGNFDGTFTQVPLSSNVDLGKNTPVGNFVVFQGLTAASITLVATAGSNDGVPRAPINAVQIVGVPEPSTIVLGLIAIAIATTFSRIGASKTRKASLA